MENKVNLKLRIFIVMIILKFEEFLNQKKNIKYGIKNRYLLWFNYSEEQVFEACMKWVKHCDGRGEHLPKLLAEVRLPLLTPLYLTDRVATEELIRTSHKCRLVFSIWNYFSFQLNYLSAKICFGLFIKPFFHYL